jgi:hypothetical protein
MSLVGVGYSGSDLIVLLMLRMVCYAMAGALALYYRSLGTASTLLRRGNIDECYLVLVHTPLFTFVRPLVLLIFTNLTCFVCFVLIRSLHHKLTEGANGHEES